MNFSLKTSRRIWTFAFLALPITVYVIIVIGPLAVSGFLSFTQYSISTSATPVFKGFENYERLLSDEEFIISFRNTFVWMASALILPTGSGLFLALLLNERVRFANGFKSLFYLPITISMVVIAQTWEWIYKPNWGLLNELLEWVGLAEWRNAWLGDTQTALAAIILAWSWQQVGLSMVIFLAGLTSIPKELVEAAQIDGASYRQTLRKVIIPLLLPSSVVVIALAVINSLRSFDIVWVLTEGGPVFSSSTLGVHMYQESFRRLNLGYGSAISTVLFALALIIIVLYFSRIRRLEHLYD